MDSMGHKVNENAGASFCHGQGGNQVFEYSRKHQLAQSDLCLDGNENFGPIKIRNCDTRITSQLWDYNKEVIQEI